MEKVQTVKTNNGLISTSIILGILLIVDVVWFIYLGSLIKEEFYGMKKTIIIFLSPIIIGLVTITYRQIKRIIELKKNK